MERGSIVFGILFLLVPLLLALSVLVFPGAAFAMTIGIISLLTLGFTWAIVFVDLG